MKRILEQEYHSLIKLVVFKNFAHFITIRLILITKNYCKGEFLDFQRILLNCLINKAKGKIMLLFPGSVCLVF